MVDVVSRRCSCGKCTPSFGMLGGSATHCKECKDEGMVDIRSTSRIINAHGVFWLGLMENFAEHQKPFGPKTQKKNRSTHPALSHARPSPIAHTPHTQQHQIHQIIIILMVSIFCTSSVKLHQVIWGGLSQSACPERLQTPILSCASRSLVSQVDDSSSRLMKVDQG